MLIQFTVENFLSYSKHTVFSLVATNDEEHPNHLIKSVGKASKNILRAAAIYGANASGKSNLVKAMAFAQDLILEGTGADESLPITPYKLRDNHKQPSRFQFVFCYKDIEYSYGFSLTHTRISEEFLYAKPSGREVKYYERVTSEDLKTEVNFGLSLTKGNKDKQKFLEYKAEDTRPNQLLLTAIFDGNMKDRVEELKPVIQWFRFVLTIVEAESRYRELVTRTHTTDALKNFLGGFLNIGDTGIRCVETSEIPLDWNRDLSRIPSEFREEIIRNFNKSLPDESGIPAQSKILEIISPQLGRVYIRQDEDGNLILLKFLLKHEGEDGKLIDFEIQEESDGTQRVIDLVPMLFDMQRGEETVMVIDEIDRRMHPHLSRLILETALSCQEKSQLIFTTHDTNMLDLELLRRDEIWFVEKDKAGSSHLYSLAEFKVRPDLQIEKGYLNGRFGAIPFIGDVSSLGWHEKSSTNIEAESHA